MIESKEYTEIINIAKMNNIFSNALNNSNIKKSLADIKEERDNIETIISELRNVLSQFETLVKKVFPNYDKLKKKYTAFEVISKNTSSSIVRDSSGNFVIRSSSDSSSSSNKSSSEQLVLKNTSSSIVRDFNGNFIIKSNR